MESQSIRSLRWPVALTAAAALSLMLAACGGQLSTPAATEATTAATEATEAAADNSPGSVAVPAETVAPPAEVSEGAASERPAAERDGMYTAAPEMTIDPSKYYYATFKTDKGDIKVQLFADRAPLAVNNLVFLAREGFYNDTTFHRVLDGFMMQGGDPTGTGAGGPGYQFKNEVFPGATFDRPGLLAMANSGPDTNVSQFFITFDAAPWLDGGYTQFGEVVSGLDVLDKITRRDPTTNPDFTGDKLYTVVIEESDTSVMPTPTPPPPTPTPFAPSAATGNDRPLASIPPAERDGYFNAPPEQVIDTAKTYTATIKTAAGDIVVALYDDLAPLAVNNFVVLSDLGFYDGLPINQVNPEEIVVFGSPSGDPNADVGYRFSPEVNLQVEDAPGIVTYRVVDQTADGAFVASGSQIFLSIIAPPAGAGESYSYFGKIVEGMDVLGQLVANDPIESITIEAR
ncbi:MAG: peptidylprolyl isomerase [Anaerolineales bacterium]|nr:peptidylprolyl isomerase [Anaerolineales bacterium]